VTKFVPVHEKEYHLFVISQDMTHFEHIHPEMRPDGTRTISRSKRTVVVRVSWEETEPAPASSARKIDTPRHPPPLKLRRTSLVVIVLP